MSNTITIGIADLNIARAPDVLVTYALGSCVGICIYDANSHIGGLAHIMLPDSKLMPAGNVQIAKFADTAIVQLVKNLELAGARRSFLKAKIAGGAQMFAALSNSDIANIGQRNVVAVKRVLNELHIPIIAEDVGANYGRTLYFYAQDGTMRIKSGNKGEWVF